VNGYVRIRQIAEAISHRRTPVPELSVEDAEAAQHIVTPFTPFVLCDFYLASEISRYSLSRLNPRALELSRTTVQRVRRGSVLYVEVDQLKRFVSRLLPRIDHQFILITGKWNLPGLSVTPEVLRVLKSPHLLAWYSQNQTLPGLNIRPFPFGVRLDGAVAVHSLMSDAPLVKSQDVFVPYATVHGHLEDPVKRLRMELRPLASPQLPHSEYLANIAKSRFVISPPGDRPDTYRHWESVALGAVPVTIPIPGFRELFGESIAFRNDLTEAAGGRNLPWSNRADPGLVTVSYWRAAVHQWR